jgi:hypothetical protein
MSSMSVTEIEGLIYLEGPFGNRLTEPELCRVLWDTTESSWELRFLTAHHLSVPPENVGGVWVRFDDTEGQVRVRQLQGDTDVVVILPTA